MRNYPGILLPFFMVIALSAAAPLASADENRVCAEHSTGTKVAGNFASNQPLVHSLLDLGRRSKVCFGLRALDSLAFTRVLHISATDAPVKEIIASMLTALPGYSLEESSSHVIVLGRLHSVPAHSLYDRVLPTFRSSRAPLNTVSYALKMQLAIEVNPSIQGFAGTYNPGDSNDLVGPIEKNGKRVWELLNEIVGQSTGAMWITSMPESKATATVTLSLWTIIEYTSSPIEAASAISELSPQFQSTTKPR
jgi:hypothetical protein